MFRNKKNPDIGFKTYLPKRLFRWGGIVSLLIVVVGLSITIIQQVQFQHRRNAYFESEAGKEALRRKQEILDRAAGVKQINQRLTVAVETGNNKLIVTLQKELEKEKEKFKAWFRANLEEGLQQDSIRDFQTNFPGENFIEYDEGKGIPVSLAHDAEGVVKPEFIGPGGAVEHEGRVYPLPNNLMVFLPMELSGDGIDTEGYLEDLLDDGQLDKGYYLGSRSGAKGVSIPARTQGIGPITTPTDTAERHEKGTIAESLAEETPAIDVDEFLSEFISEQEVQVPDQNADSRYPPDLRIEPNPQALKRTSSENDTYIEIQALFEGLLNDEITDQEFESLLNQLVEESIYKDLKASQSVTESPSLQPGTQRPQHHPSQPRQNSPDSPTKERNPVISPDYPSKDNPKQRE